MTNNEKIALYLGMQKTDIGWYDAEVNLYLGYTKDNVFDELLFNVSADWAWSAAVKVFDEGEMTDSTEAALNNALCHMDSNRICIAVINHIKLKGNI